MATHLFPKCRVKTLSAEHQRDFWWANEAHKNQGPTHLQKAQKKVLRTISCGGVSNA